MFTPSLNVEPFFNSPFGLDYATKSRPVSGVALMVHKLMEGESLDNTSHTIKVYVDPLQPAAGFMKFTEQGFLEYLQNQNRAFPCDPGVRPKGVVLLMGRRAGKTSLLLNKALYDTSMALSSPNYSEVLGPQSSADFLVSTFSPESVRIYKKHTDNITMGTWLGSKLSTMTHSSMYFETQNPKRQARIFYRSTSTLRGVTPFSWYVDEFDYCKNFEQTSETVLPTLTSIGSQYIFVGSGKAASNSMIAPNFFNYTRDKPDYLGLVLHTWEMNPVVPHAVYLDALRQTGTLDDYMAVTPRRL